MRKGGGGERRGGVGIEDRIKVARGIEKGEGRRRREWK